MPGLIVFQLPDCGIDPGHPVNQSVELQPLGGLVSGHELQMMSNLVSAARNVKKRHPYNGFASFRGRRGQFRGSTPIPGFSELRR